MHSERSILRDGFRLGRLFRVDIHIHLILVIILALQFIHELLRKPPEGYEFVQSPIVMFLAFAISLSVSILLHEFGHAFASRRVGGDCGRIMLWPLGGLAYCEYPESPQSKFLVAIGGPLVNVALISVSGIVCLSVGWALFPFDPASNLGFLELLFQYTFTWNLVLVIVNLLPCYPLDGGSVLHAKLWSRMGTEPGSLLRTLEISRIAAIAMLVLGGILFFMRFTSPTWELEHPFLDKFAFILVLGGIMHFQEARMARMRLMHGEMEDSGGIFGYDFSRGYTSLEQGPGGSGSRERERKPSFLEKRRAERERKEQERKIQEEREMRRRLDELLAKISDEGMGSLSNEERRFLDRASEQLRESEAGRE